MARRFTCDLEEPGFETHDSERMIQHVEDAHGIRLTTLGDEEERKKKQEQWNNFWQDHIKIEIAPSFQEGRE